MRIRFLLFLFILPICAAAQKDLYPYYQQNAVIVAPSYDCYHQNLDAGLAAKRRGDCSTALKHFQEALDCEEVAGNTRWTNELEALIQQCHAATGHNAMKEMDGSVLTRPQQAPVVRRRYVPSKDFLAYSGDSCFVVTSREADRAYRAGFWDDAAKLYRAAKNCRDADQSERAGMNARISACRDAAEDELRQKEQAAVRAARHAIANNSADDAQDNLRDFNRTLAYRLADFANEYIAPEDNPRCIQALLDAWYYRPVAPSDGTSVFQVPLCYQIAGNLPAGTEIRHLSRNNKGKIYAFAANQNLLWSWDARSFEPQEPIQLGEKYSSYEASPDGETLVFAKNNQYLFWRSPRQSVKVPTTTSYASCFSKNGDFFYYLDIEEQAIKAISLKDAFSSRKGMAKKGNPVKYFSNIGQDLNNFAVYQDACWLAYSDRIEIWQQRAQTKTWSLVKTFMLGRLPQYTLKIYLYPETGAAIVSGDSSMVFNLNAAFDTVSVLIPTPVISGQFFAVTDDGSLVATTKMNDFSAPDRLIVNTTNDGTALFSTLMNHNDWPEFPVAIFSRDNAWLFSVSLDGTLYAWDLSSSESDWLYNVGDVDAMALTPDGMNLVARKGRNWMLIDSDSRQKSKDILTVKDRDIKMFALSNAWVAYQSTPDSIHLKSFQTDQTFEFPVRMPDSKIPITAFSPDENLIAYTDAAKSVTIRSLESGAVIATKIFDGDISAIQLLPGSEEVVVVQGNEDPVSRNIRTIAKIWRFVQQDAKMRVVRLHNYEIKMVNVAPNGNRIAFSDGRDVRIFNLSDLSDETVRIYRNVHRDKEVGISAFAFHPNGLAMAVGYADGSVNMWDADKGTVLFRLQKTSLGDQFWVKTIAFTNGGRKLRQINSDLSLATRDLDPATIRAQAQTNYRKLVPFSPEQIREYELESAMNYPGNFERLAESGEWPLIQAFFQYYYQQASRSNNISEVTRYSERAFILYRQLDPPTQNTLRGTMLEIYRDLHWKWILRGRVKEATDLVNHINQYFDRPFVAIEADAYTELLAGNLRAAAKSFTDWSILAYRNRPQDGLDSRPALDTLQNKIRQMVEYDLLDASQRAFICGMFGSITDLGSICTEKSKPSDVPFDNETRVQWNILLNRVKAGRTNNLDRRDKLLQSALESARAQYRQNPEKTRLTLQELVYEVAENDYARGKFEQGSKDAAPYFRKSIALLQDAKLNHTQDAADSARLYLLTQNYFEIGKLLLQQDHISEGVNELTLGTRQADSYLKVASDTLSNNESALGLFSELYEQLGVGLLLSGNAAAAQDAFQVADRFQQYNYYSSADQRAINAGHADLLAGDTIGALIQYGAIQHEKDLGSTLALLERLSIKNPDKKTMLNGFIPRLKAAVLANISLNTNIINYWFARSKYEMFIFQSKWDSTLYWNEQALKYAAAALDTTVEDFSIKEIWLREHISLSFYLILAQGQKTEALERAIKLSESALQYMQAKYPTYQYRDLLKTNLAHAYWLRNKPGDRAKSLQYYQEYLQSTPDYGKDNWETLEKDFRDFSNAGIHFPDFPALMEAIKPDGE